MFDYQQVDDGWYEVFRGTVIFHYPIQILSKFQHASQIKLNFTM